MLPERQTLSHGDDEVKLREGSFDPSAMANQTKQRKNKEQPTFRLAAPDLSECCRPHRKFGDGVGVGSAGVGEGVPVGVPSGEAVGEGCGLTSLHPARQVSNAVLQAAWFAFASLRQAWY